MTSLLIHAGCCLYTVATRGALLFVRTRHCDASPYALNNPRLMRCTTFPNSTPHLNVSRLRRFTCDHRTLKHTCMAFLFSMFSLPCIVHPDCEISLFYRVTKLLRIACTDPFYCPFYEIDANVFVWVDGVSIPDRGNRCLSSTTRPDRLWCPPSFLFCGYQRFFRGR